MQDATTPRKELYRFLENKQRVHFGNILASLNQEAEDELCVALTAYARWKLTRHFGNPYLNDLYKQLCRNIDWHNSLREYWGNEVEF